MEARELTKEELSAMCAQLLTRLELGCAQCEHLASDEAGPHVAGVCTKPGNFFVHKFVPFWIRGCTDFSRREGL